MQTQIPAVAEPAKNWAHVDAANRMLRGIALKFFQRTVE